jgi:hypothetical protein
MKVDIILGVHQPKFTVKNTNLSIGNVFTHFGVVDEEKWREMK